MPTDSFGAWLASKHTSVFDESIAGAQRALGDIADEEAALDAALERAEGHAHEDEEAAAR